jgi:hypothetical protein
MILNSVSEIQTDLAALVFILCLYPHISSDYNTNRDELIQKLHKQAAVLNKKGPLESKGVCLKCEGVLGVKDNSKMGDNKKEQKSDFSKKETFSLWKQFLSTQTHVQFSSLFPTLTSSTTVLVPDQKQHEILLDNHTVQGHVNVCTCDQNNNSKNQNVAYNNLNLNPLDQSLSPLAIVAYQLVNQQMTGRPYYKSTTQSQSINGNKTVEIADHNSHPPHPSHPSQLPKLLFGSN